MTKHRYNEPSKDKICSKYEKRVVKWLNRCRDAFVQRGVSCSEVGSVDLDEEERWAFLVQWQDASKLSEDVDVQFRIVWSGVYGDDPGGVTFRIDLTAVGGEIVGQVSPYNYTSQCWVVRKDGLAVEERFRLVEGVLAQDVVDYVLAWEKKRDTRQKEQTNAR